MLLIVASISIKLPDGRQLSVNTNKRCPAVKVNEPDRLHNYAQLALELGLCYRHFIDCIKSADRTRMLRLLKVMLMIIKADSFQAKYGDEILRFLVIQLHVLSEEDANKMFYSMFVNSSGRVDGYIPVDLQMEFLIRLYKKHIKHMISNKRDDNITRRVNALAGLHDIMENFDNITVRVTRTKKHSCASKEEDEKSILSDLRECKPFTYVSGRSVVGFTHVECSVMAKLDNCKFIQWLNVRSAEHAKLQHN